MVVAMRRDGDDLWESNGWQVPSRRAIVMNNNR